MEKIIDYFRSSPLIARTGSPWRDLPAHFGKWNTVFKRYRDWVKAGVFETILHL